MFGTNSDANFASGNLEAGESKFYSYNRCYHCQKRNKTRLACF